MKKFILIVFYCMLSLCLLNGCVNTSNIQSSDPLRIDIDTAKEKANYHAQCFVDKKFADVLKDCSKDVQSKITVQNLDQAWTSATSTQGNFIGIHSVETSSDANLVTTIVTLKYEKTGVALTLVYDNNGIITGLWIKNVVIDPTVTLSENEKEIKVGQHELNGIVSTPSNSTDYPVVIMIQGSGASDYDETVGKGNNKPFKDISKYLTEKGIATIRYNKRYYQKPELVAEDMTVYTEYIDDVNWLIDYAYKNISKDIYLLGHSQGGMSVAKIANDNPNVKGIISMAGTPRPFEDVILEQNKVTLEIDTTLDATKKQEILKQVEAEYAKVKDIENCKDAQIFGLPISYWKSLKELDCENLSKSLNIPMLIMQGKKDFQVNYENDYLYWKEILKGKDNAIFKEYDNLNHLFMPSILNGAFDIAEYDTENHVYDNVLQDITDFILK